MKHNDSRWVLKLPGNDELIPIRFGEGTPNEPGAEWMNPLFAGRKDARIFFQVYKEGAGWWHVMKFFLGEVKDAVERAAADPTGPATRCSRVQTCRAHASGGRPCARVTPSTSVGSTPSARVTITPSARARPPIGSRSGPRGRSRSRSVVRVASMSTRSRSR